MKILVTGGAGFIGSNFIYYILNKYPDYRVVNLDKLTYAGSLDNLKEVELKFKDRYEFIKGDICDEILVDKIMGSVDAVVNFAAESHVDKSIESPDSFIETNIMGTYTLLKSALKNNKKRFHHISTDEVFGALPLDNEKEKFSESTPYNPRSPYSASKASADHLANVFFHTYGLPVTISNCSNNYGPFQFPEKIIPLFILNALNGKPLPIYGNGKCVRDYIFVDDHCRGVDLVLHNGKMGEKYCFGGNSEKNGIEIADTILGILGKSDTLKEFVKDRPGHDVRYAIDFTKAKKELGWSPVVSFEEGIRKTIDWYKNNEEWYKKLI
ncbi:MAG: dTDP-glucose 4,6-dehydratase [Candidatus Nomurabacteria bacterium]|nr:dTDP-glucose 4,6-dehydratase [Candidatus Nomurabacteria bacterium]